MALFTPLLDDVNVLPFVKVEIGALICPLNSPKNATETLLNKVTDDVLESQEASFSLVRL